MYFETVHEPRLCHCVGTSTKIVSLCLYKSQDCVKIVPIIPDFETGSSRSCTKVQDVMCQKAVAFS